MFEFKQIISYFKNSQFLIIVKLIIKERIIDFMNSFIYYYGKKIKCLKICLNFSLWS